VEVVRLYETVLHRLPDAAGLSGWAAARANGLLLQGMAEAFVGSGEFQGRFGELGNRDFVARLYQTALDRPADPAGLDAWTAALDSRALGRGDVVLGFALSAEMTRKVTPLMAEGILFA
jgi:serralysin